MALRLAQFTLRSLTASLRSTYRAREFPPPRPSAA